MLALHFAAVPEAEDDTLTLYWTTLPCFMLTAVGSVLGFRDRFADTRCGLSKSALRSDCGDYW